MLSISSICPGTQNDHRKGRLIQNGGRDAKLLSAFSFMGPIGSQWFSANAAFEYLLYCLWLLVRKKNSCQTY
jgi:hypothetical protein